MVFVLESAGFFQPTVPCLEKATMTGKNHNLNHPRVEALIQELSQLMGPDAKAGIFEKIFKKIHLREKISRNTSL